MKRNLLTLLLIMIGFGVFAQETPVTKANFELAAKFSPNRLKKMVFSSGVRPNWLKSSEKFWYTYRTSEGIFYYLVDPVKSTKNELFNAVKMAADMSRLTGDPFDAQHMYISKLKFINNEKTLQFQVKSKLVEEEEKDEVGDSQEEKKEDEKKEDEKKEDAKKKMVAKVWHFEYALASKELNLIDDFDKQLEQKKW
ncbi:MAG: dipeptidyl-peptidase-4, partial [Ancylomarina sp.]